MKSNPEVHRVAKKEGREQMRHLVIVLTFAFCAIGWAQESRTGKTPGTEAGGIVEKATYAVHTLEGVVILPPVEEVPIPEPIPVEVVGEREVVSPRKPVKEKQSLVRGKRIELLPVEEVDWPEPSPVTVEPGERGRLWGEWYNDVTIGSYPYEHPEIARVPDSQNRFFAVAYDQSYGSVDLYRFTVVSDGVSLDTVTIDWGRYWSVSSTVNDPSPGCAVTPDHVFVVYETGGNVYVRKYNHGGTLLATYNVATASYAEYYPAIATDAECYPGVPWLYVVWTQDDAGAGTEVYFRVWDTSWSPQSGPIGIFGAGSAANHDYPDICFDCSSSDRVHTVCWQNTDDRIAYRGATGYGNDPGDWGSAFYISPSGYTCRLGRVDDQGDRVLVTWEWLDGSNIYAMYSFSTSGGINSGNFQGPYYFTAEKWRPVPVLKNTSSQWYIVCWRSGFWVQGLKTTNPSSSWQSATISDRSYSDLPWFSFGGTTCANNRLAVVWADGVTHMAFDWERCVVGVAEEADAAASPSFSFRARPNPVLHKAELACSVPIRCRVRLEIFDIAGRRIRLLHDRVEEAGLRSFFWDRRSEDGSVVSAGVYFARIQAGRHTAAKKLVILK